MKVLLFGRYPWNEVVGPPEEMDELDGGTYVEWREGGKMEEVEKRRKGRVERGWMPDHVERVGDWDEVVRRLERWEEEGRPAFV